MRCREQGQQYESTLAPTNMTLESGQFAVHRPLNEADVGLCVSLQRRIWGSSLVSRTLDGDPVQKVP